MILHTPRGRIVVSLFMTPWRRWRQAGGAKTGSHIYGWCGPLTFAYRRTQKIELKWVIEWIVLLSCVLAIAIVTDWLHWPYWTAAVGAVCCGLSFWVVGPLMRRIRH
jgi:hypothetical protein